MPKMKSHKGLRKRVKRTGSGKLSRHRAKYPGGKSARRRAQARRPDLVHGARRKTADVLLGKT